MKADTFIKLLRKVVREEVQSVVREELGLLLEVKEPMKIVTETKKPTVKNSMVESIRPVAKQPSKPTSFTNNNVLNDILNETANGGEWRSVVEATSQMAPNFGPIGGAYGGITETTVVSNVDQMLASAKPAGDVSNVRIDTVPDFSGLMKTMKEKGQI
jgi:hypothetical protein